MQQLVRYSEFQKAIGSGPAVIDFTAAWCGPCRQIAPKIEELARVHEDVKFYKVDIDLAPDIAEKNKVRSVPTFCFFKGGKAVGEVVGADLPAVKRNLKLLHVPPGRG